MPVRDPQGARPGRLGLHAGSAILAGTVSLTTLRVSVLAVVASLVGPPIVGASCELWCHVAMGHADSIHEPTASVDHVAMGHEGHQQGPGVTGRHDCAHDPGVVETFVPTAGWGHAVQGPTDPIPALSPTPDAIDSLRRSNSAQDRSPPGYTLAASLVRTSVLRL